MILNINVCFAGKRNAVYDDTGEGNAVRGLSAFEPGTRRTAEGGHLIYGHVFNSSPVRRVNGIIEPAGGAGPRSDSERRPVAVVTRAKNFCVGWVKRRRRKANRFRAEWKGDVLEFSTGEKSPPIVVQSGRPSFTSNSRFFPADEHRPSSYNGRYNDSRSST